MPAEGGGRSNAGEWASRSSNFGYLAAHEPLLATLGAAAEVYLLTDPNTAMFKARQFGEELTRYLIRLLRLTGTGSRQVDRIGALARHGVVVPQVRAWLDEVRLTGNDAVHEYYAEARAALRSVECCFNLGDWLHRALTPEDTTHRVFLPPEPDTQRSADTPAARRELADLRTELADYRRRLEESRQKFDGHETQLERERAAAEAARSELTRATADRAALQARLDELSATLEALRAGGPAPMELVSAAGRDVLVANAQRAARPLLSEAQVRVEIDAMLRRAGWQVQDVAELNLTAGQGVAVREVTTAAGRADYLLYVDRSLVGVIEAKREGADLSGAQRQAARYAAGLTASQRLSAWRATLPFQYVADGNQVRFRNALDPDARTRVVFAVHRPETIARWMREADADRSAPTFRARMRSLPDIFLDEKPLRPAQARAIVGLERSLARDEPRALIQMATGAGKTYTVVAESHRLLKHADARRILFLVDRNNLGKQAATEFANYQIPDDGRKFIDLYAVQRLSGPSILDSSSVVISTIQRLWKTLTGQTVPDVDDDDPEQDSYDLVDEPVDVGYNAAIPPEAFDMIVVDECHRSIYGRWRAVLEYFDAHVVGLTATPVAQTFGFFHQNLVSEYTYEQAVADGVNVDFDVYRIRTEIGEQGGTIPAETVVPIRDRRTRRERYQELEDDLVYSATEEGKKVISKGRLRLVLETFRDKLFTEIFPPAGGRARGTVPKTLIFAKDDNHAEEIVGMVREVFGKGDEFCAKITHAARRHDQLLQAFRNSPELRIAVTVDMIATGTDVRPLECVFFLRDVKTWSYFEQMKGRGARTVDATEFQAVTPDALSKDRFVIVDAVGVTDSPRVDARPLVRRSERQISLEKLLGKAAALTVDDDEVATLAGRLARLGQQITPDERDELTELADGRPLSDIVGGLVRAIDPDEQDAARTAGGPTAVRNLVLDALEPLAGNPRLRQRILEIRRSHDIVYDEVGIDVLLAAQGIPPTERAMRIVESWQGYLADHQDEIVPLEVAFRERRNLQEVYHRLKQIAREIKPPQYAWTTDKLWDAYATLGKTAGRPHTSGGVVDLIGVLRFELGLDTEVRPYRSLVEERFAAWLARQEQAGAQYSEPQLWWLHRVVDVVATSATIEPENLDQLPFTERGGVEGFLATFGHDTAQHLLEDLNKELSA